MKTLYWLVMYLLLGLWLVISPYALGFVENMHAYWNAIACGVVSLVTALIGMYYGREESNEHSFSHKSAKAT